MMALIGGADHRRRGYETTNHMARPAQDHARSQLIGFHEPSPCPICA